MIVYIKQHSAHAGKWIYEGYFKAWAALGHQPIYYNSLDEINTSQEYYLMSLDSLVNKENFHVLEAAKRVFLFVQPTNFPPPWGQHPNFVSSVDKTVLSRLNQQTNITKWSFLEQNQHHAEWAPWKTVPLAYDHISYSGAVKNPSHAFDVCFIGGRANNGFDEKYRIMLSIFEEFQKTKMSCGFFVDKNLTHEQEKSLLYNSKIAINIHDAYQKLLGLDANERSFKSLGLNGVLLSDSNGQLNRLFPSMKTASSPTEYCEIANSYLSMNTTDFLDMKEKNRELTLSKHTYVARIRELLEHEI